MIPRFWFTYINIPHIARVSYLGAAAGWVSVSAHLADILGSVNCLQVICSAPESRCKHTGCRGRLGTRTQQRLHQHLKDRCGNNKIKYFSVFVCFMNQFHVLT